MRKYIIYIIFLLIILSCNTYQYSSKPVDKKDYVTAVNEFCDTTYFYINQLDYLFGKNEFKKWQFFYNDKWYQGEFWYYELKY